MATVKISNYIYVQGDIVARDGDNVTVEVDGKTWTGKAVGTI